MSEPVIVEQQTYVFFEVVAVKMIIDKGGFFFG
jgi:hypothetical protein